MTIYDYREHAGYIETRLNGKRLMTLPQLNKGSAFTAEERDTFNLTGKLPARIETLDEQVTRAYLQFSQFQLDMQKHIYLNSLHDRHQVLFYKLVSEHMAEMVPLIYTPCIGTAVQQFSHEFRQPRGLFMNYEDRGQMANILDNRTNPDIDLIVVTDGEGVLGIGDQGVGSINIPIAKLMIYTLCAGISPLRTLPIYLDVGTSNPLHLNDPLYLGARHERIRGKAYDDFIAQFIDLVQQKFPEAFLHFEDFGRDNAARILKHYQYTSCTFNDDIQGTGAVALAGVLAAVKQAGSSLEKQRIVVFGAGTAGMGIVDQIYQAMRRVGLSEKDARDRFWLIDRAGLLLDSDDHLTDMQKPYAKPRELVKHWHTEANGMMTLLETVRQIKPTILIGCSAQSGAFTEEIVKTMQQHTPQPIIFPLSNPTLFAEATPENIIRWTDGKALIATGSPFAPVNYKNKAYAIAQCNNALIYPGIGLGVLAARARHLTDNMLWAACETLSRQGSHDIILPGLTQARESALAVAVAVAKEAMRENLARSPEILKISPDNTDELSRYIYSLMWQPQYVPLRPKA